MLTKILKLKRNDESTLTELYKASFKEKEKFMAYLSVRKKKLLPSSPLLQKKCLEAASKASSIFSIQLIQEYLFLDKKLYDVMNRKGYRINTPGMIYGNWSIRIPLNLQQLVNSGRYKTLNKNIKNINGLSERV